jgi:Transglycosylase SLT domain
MANLGTNFYPKLVKISSELGINPEDVLAIMVSESGINPSAREHHTNATGLMQFMPNTLRGLGYTGDPNDFGKLTGEDQLDYVKKLISSNMRLNGGPFTSPGQYYVANLFPIALKLPGVREGKASTLILELNPERVGEYSKKYYDIGSKIKAGLESKAYKANPLFDREKKGMITYGDMMKQMEINKRNPLYLKAIAEMKNQTGYQGSSKEQNVSLKGQNISLKDQDNFNKYVEQLRGKNDIYDQLTQTPNVKQNQENNLENILDQYLKMVAQVDKRLYHKYLPNHHAVIKVAALEYTDGIEFARILSSVLQEELKAKAFTHTDGEKIEINCVIKGPEKKCFEAIEILTDMTKQAFSQATEKIGKVIIGTEVITNKKSYKELLTLQSAELHHRKFLLKFI